MTAPVTRPLLRFLRTPKGLLLIIFIGLLAVSSLKLDGDVVTSKVIVAAVTAAAIDIAVTYWRRGQWILPDGAVLTGMIVAFVLRPQESWLVLVVTVAVAILSKHALRTHWSNILNPAAFALVVAAIVLHTGQSWWGALPDLGIIGALVLLVAGGFIADRINKLPMILAFFGAYFTLFTVASIFRLLRRCRDLSNARPPGGALLCLLHAGRPADQPRSSRRPDRLRHDRRSRCLLHLYAVRRRLFSARRLARR